MPCREQKGRCRSSIIKCTRFRGGEIKVRAIYSRSGTSVSSTRASFAEHVSPTGSSIGRWDSYCRFPAVTRITLDSSLFLSLSLILSVSGSSIQSAPIGRAILTDEGGMRDFDRWGKDARFWQMRELSFICITKYLLLFFSSRTICANIFFKRTLSNIYREIVMRIEISDFELGVFKFIIPSLTVFVNQK